MADIEPEFDVEKDLPEFLLSVLDWTEECIHNSEADINDLQAQSEGDIGVCGTAVLVNFLCGISVILILNCVIAVFSESAG